VASRDNLFLLQASIISREVHILCKMSILQGQVPIVEGQGLRQELVGKLQVPILEGQGVRQVPILEGQGLRQELVGKLQVPILEGQGVWE
jgi:hypothetical protein